MMHRRRRNLRGPRPKKPNIYEILARQAMIRQTTPLPDTPEGVESFPRPEDGENNPMIQALLEWSESFSREIIESANKNPSDDDYLTR